MKRRVDLEKAAEGEIFGALAIGPRKHRSAPAGRGSLTLAQSRAAAALARSLLEVAKDAGAVGKCVPVGDLFFELRQDEGGEVLSIRKPSADNVQ